MLFKSKKSFGKRFKWDETRILKWCIRTVSEKMELAVRLKERVWQLNPYLMASIYPFRWPLSTLFFEYLLRERWERKKERDTGDKREGQTRESSSQGKRIQAIRIVLSFETYGRHKETCVFFSFPCHFLTSCINFFLNFFFFLLYLSCVSSVPLSLPSFGVSQDSKFSPFYLLWCSSWSPSCYSCCSLSDASRRRLPHPPLLDSVRRHLDEEERRGEERRAKSMSCVCYVFMVSLLLSFLPLPFLFPSFSFPFPSSSRLHLWCSYRLLVLLLFSYFSSSSCSFSCPFLPWFSLDSLCLIFLLHSMRHNREEGNRVYVVQKIKGKNPVPTETEKREEKEQKTWTIFCAGISC